MGSKQLLVRPSPIGLKGEKSVESFFSWLSRLAWANGFKDARRLLLAENIGRSCNTDFGFRAIRIRLLRLGGQDERALNLFSLARVLAIVGIEREPRQARKWLLRAPHTNALPHQACVQCLAGQIAYWPRDGRASFSTQCPIHKLRLIDCCPACGSRLVLDNNRRVPLRACSTCRFDMALAPVPKLKPDEIVPTHWYEPSSQTPHPCGTGWISKRALWEGLNSILTFVCKPGSGRSLLQARIAEPHFRLFEMIQETEPTAFDFHETELRHRMLVFASWLMDGWPERILEMSSQARLHRPLHTTAICAARNWALSPFTLSKANLPVEDLYAGSFA